MSATVSQQLALDLLSTVKDELHAGLAEQAVSNFCRAYALEPLLSTRRLVALPSYNVQIVVATLEDWCTCGLAFGTTLLKRYGIPLSWEQVCDVILCPDLAPHSLQAWSVKIKFQMQGGRYAHVVDTCTAALKTFAGRQGSERHVFWAQRGLAYMLLNDSLSAVTDYLSAFQDNPVACQVYVTKCQSGYVRCILNAFYHALAKLDPEDASAHAEGLPVIKLYQFVLIFEKDLGVYGDCASHMMKQRRFNEATKLLSVALRNLPGNCAAVDKLRLLFLRAECHLALDDIDTALEEYVAAASLGEDFTRVAFQSLPLHQQGALVARAKCVASGILVQCQMKSASCSLDAERTKTKLKRAAGFFQLLHLMDERYVDALYSAAECHKLLGSFTEAIELLTRFLSLRPKSSDAHYDRASCYLECGDMESALNDYNTSLSMQPAFVQALCGRAWLWLKRGEPEKAVVDFAAANTASTVLSACWIQQLQEKEQVDLKTKLRDYLTCAPEETPNSGGLDEKSLAVCDVMTRAWPEDVPCQLLYADILVSLKKMDEAQAVLEELLKNNTYELTATARLAALQLTQGSVTSSVDEFVLAAKRYGEEKLKTVLLSVKEEHRTEIARETHCEGVKRFNANPHDPAAETLFTVAVSAAPRRAWESFLWRAKARWQLGNLEPALADCTSALAIKEDAAEVLCWRGLISLHMKRDAACLDFVKVLGVNPDALKSFVVSLCEEEKPRLLACLEACAQWLFCKYMATGTNLRCILRLCRLLVHLERTSSLFRSNYADALIINGDYRRAAVQLDEAERYCPEDLSVVSRGGLVHMMLGNVDVCVAKLSHIAAVEPKSREFTFTKFNEVQKLTLVSASVAHARRPSCDDDRALLYYTVAVVAGERQNPEVLRMRSQCLERLRCYKRAIVDLSAVITIGPQRIGDLCARANLHILNENVRAACDDFIVAMEMNKVVAMTFISRCPVGEDALCQLFVNAARDEAHGRSLAGGLKICNYGLTIDPSNSELAELKAQLEYSAKKCKAKRSVSSL